MNLLSVENLTVSFGDRLLFSDLTFGISKGQKVALVAKNGSGKTTLFRCLAGMHTPDSGTITFRSDVRVSFLNQDDDLPEEQTIKDTVLGGMESEMQAITHYNRCLAEDASQDEIQKAFDTVERLNAWDVEHRVYEVLGHLGINLPEKRIGELSGGQRKRVQLARVLIESPDFILLDEPTNHLDIKMIEWLENYLQTANCTLLMVTHDRYFLDRVCDEVLELADTNIYKYKGNFTYYLEQKALREELQSVTLDKARSFLKKELEWIRRQPKARGTKSKARTEAFYDKKAETQGPGQDEELKLEVSFNRLGTKTIEFHNVSKSFPGHELLKKFTYAVKRDEKMGLVGPNGSGKTTLMRMIAGDEEPDSGKVVIGETVELGYYRQSHFEFTDDQRVIEAITEIAEVIPLKGGRKLTAAQLLERFQFNRKMHYQVVGQLSGGEKKRLALCRVLMRNPNVLMLDEPTNDLDIYTLSALEDYLQQFPGVVIVVSHDRYFIDKVVDHLFVFRGGGELREFPGNYSQYLAWEAGNQQQQKENKPRSAPPIEKVEKESTGKTKLSFKEKLEFERLEEEIAGLEQQKAELEAQLASETDHEALTEYSAKLGEVMAAIDDKTLRWLELSEFA
ncbi:MAG: ABC transporter ATP-binding protein [Cryomorphaceae bacterium]|nr:MAG: ABC transporter ATP-binding protein [Cryomorphaceae bacterium]